METKETIDVAVMLRAVKAADEAGDRISTLINLLKEKQDGKPSSQKEDEMKKAKIGIFACRAILLRQLENKSFPDVRKKSKKDASEILTDFVQDDEKMKEFSRNDLIEFFTFFGTPRRTTNELVFDDLWFQDLSDKFRLAIKAYHLHKEENWDLGNNYNDGDNGSDNLFDNNDDSE